MINVLDHGAKGDGATDDTAAIQSALELTTGGGNVYFPKGVYLVKGSLNATNRLHCNLSGDGPGLSRIVGSMDSGLPVFDLRGARWFDVSELSVEGDPEHPPAAAFAMCRTTSHPACGGCAFDRVRLDGTFALAGWYLAHAEVIEWSGCSAVNLIAPAVVRLAPGQDTTFDGVHGVYENQTYSTGGVVYRMHGCDWTMSPACQGTVMSVGGGYKQIQVRDSWAAIYGDGVWFDFDGASDPQGLVSDVIVEGTYSEGTAACFAKVTATLRRCRVVNAGGRPTLFQCATDSIVRQLYLSNALVTAGSGETPLKFYHLRDSRLMQWTNYRNNNLYCAGDCTGNYIELVIGNLLVDGVASDNIVRREGDGS